jgi:hypothetical protein
MNHRSPTAYMRLHIGGYVSWFSIREYQYDNNNSKHSNEDGTNREPFRHGTCGSEYKHDRNNEHKEKYDEGCNPHDSKEQCTGLLDLGVIIW